MSSEDSAGWEPNGKRPAVLVSWSTGKDAAFALRTLRERAEFEVVGLLTAVLESNGSVAAHGVPESLLIRQAKAIGLPLRTFRLPDPCPNRIYEERLGDLLRLAVQEGIRHVAFGDLYLADIRSYREAVLGQVGMNCLFPLWGRDTRQLAREMIADGMRARLVKVDERRLPGDWIGHGFDERFLRSLPPGVDPCGENGEFHTFVTNSRDFQVEVPIAPGFPPEPDPAAGPGTSVKGGNSSLADGGSIG